MPDYATPHAGGPETAVTRTVKVIQFN